jgi:hypothetical protein
LREFTKINCWHLNEHESFAMWNIYADKSKGIAIQSTLDDLCGTIHGYKIKPEPTDETIWIGRIKYIDYTKDARERISNGADRFLYTRASFSNGQEIRLIISLRMAAEFGVDFSKLGIFVPVDINKLISKIYVSPTLTVRNWLSRITPYLCLLPRPSRR